MDSLLIDNQAGIQLIVFLFLGITSGIAVGWFVLREKVNAAITVSLIADQKNQIGVLVKKIEDLKQITNSISKENTQLRCDLDARDIYQNASDPHLQAIDSARSGASIAYIVENYKLIKAEAELIVSVHGN